MHQEPGPALDPDAMCRVGRLLLGADRMAPKLHAGLLLARSALRALHRTQEATQLVEFDTPPC